MQRLFIKSLLIATACLAVLYPLWVRVRSLEWALDSTFIPNLFPALGIAAFTIMWLHVVGGALEVWLKKYVDFEKFVHNTSFLVLILIIFHPLLLLIQLGFDFTKLFLYGSAIYIWLGILGWFLLLTYDVGRVFKRNNFFVRNWNAILILSTLGFLFAFFHSLGLGSDLQSGFLRKLWIFYGATAIIAAIYNYGVRMFLEKPTVGEEK